LRPSPPSLSSGIEEKEREKRKKRKKGKRRDFAEFI